MENQPYEKTSKFYDIHVLGAIALFLVLVLYGATKAKKPTYFAGSLAASALLFLSVEVAGTLYDAKQLEAAREQNLTR